MNSQEDELFPAFAQNNIPIAFMSSNLFAPYAGVFIQSLIDHANEAKNYDIIIFDLGISEPNKCLLKNLGADHTNISIRFYKNSTIFKDLQVSVLTDNFPQEVYYKILAPHILTQYSKIVVTDVDAILKRDIAEVLEIDMENYPVAAARSIIHNPYIGKMERFNYFCDVLKMKHPYSYVNIGLCVFDAERYRRELSKEIISQTAQKGFVLLDQDVLNSLLDGRIKQLDLAWNAVVPVNSRREHATDYLPEEIKQDYRRALEDPSFIHWAAQPKPWVCPDVPYGHEWWQIAMKTPFIGHIIARMIDELEQRREYYRKRYGKKVAIWDPSPDNIERDICPSL